MSDACCAVASKGPPTGGYRRVLWIALVVNVAMFCVEIVAGERAGSVSLLADAVDFLGDAGNYAISLFALAAGGLWRSRSALLKGTAMGSYGVFVLLALAWSLYHGVVPHAGTMGAVALVALVANIGVAWMLYAYREGDADMRSVWLCSRNDAVNNIAVLIAAVLVYFVHTGWPDLVVALIMSALGITAATSVIGHARAELHARPGAVVVQEFIPPPRGAD